MRLHFSERILTPEIMDQPGLDPARHAKALRGLARINAISRSDAVLWPALKDVLHGVRHSKPLRVIDVATGGGDVARKLIQRAQRAGAALNLDGCDRSAHAVALAGAAADRAGIPMRVFEHDVLVHGVPEGYDVVMCSLFLHHLTQQEALGFLRNAWQSAQRAVLVNDLLRTRLGYLLAHLGPRLLTRSDVVHYDALLSVRAAFSQPEVRALARAAGMRDPRISRHWPERFLLTGVRNA